MSYVNFTYEHVSRFQDMPTVEEQELHFLFLSFTLKFGGLIYTGYTLSFHYSVTFVGNCCDCTLLFLMKYSFD